MQNYFIVCKTQYLDNWFSEQICFILQYFLIIYEKTKRGCSHNTSAKMGSATVRYKLSTLPTLIRKNQIQADPLCNLRQILFLPPTS